VPAQVFQDLLIQDLNAHLGVVNEYLDKPIQLREWIANIGGIYNIRCSGADEYNDSQTGEKSSQEPGCITYDNQGIPTMKEENCVKLLEAGFLPTSNRYLHDKLKLVIQKACDKVSEKLHIEIAKSSTLICIADDLGVLEEGEVSIRFGEPFLDEETGRYSFYIQGDVLVARVLSLPSSC
jgi:RNA dependent RNA polymerase